VAAGPAPDYGQTVGDYDGHAKSGQDASSQATLREIHRELALCTPGIGPEPRRYFVFNYCLTLSPTGLPDVLPPYEYSLEYVDSFDTPGHEHHEKSRQMMISWLAMACLLHDIGFREGFAACVGSQLASLVDDGGENSTCDSLFGRLKYMYDNLPEWMKVHMPLSFTKMRITCKPRRSYIVGDARRGNIGRGGTYDTAVIDEAAYIELSEGTHRALGGGNVKKIVYQSTPNGKANVFGRIRFARSTNFHKHSYKWTRHPQKAEGRYKDEEDGRDRSPTYDEATRDLLPEDRAREWDLDYHHSIAGLIFPEFDSTYFPSGNVVPSERAKYNPLAGPLYAGIDFGKARKTVAAIGQHYAARRRIVVIAEYVGRHRNAPKNAEELAKTIRSLGYEGPLSDVICIPDPSALFEEQGSGESIWGYYRKAGFLTHGEPLVTGPNSVRAGNEVVRNKFINRELLFGEDCTTLIDDATEYSRPVDRVTGDVRSDEPKHDVHSHGMDAVRYLTTHFYTVEDAQGEGILLEDGPDDSVSAIPARRDVPRQRPGRPWKPIASNKKRF
jgi:hypothetical protein